MNPIHLKSRILLITTLILIISFLIIFTLVFFAQENIYDVSLQVFINGILRVFVPVVLFGLIGPDLILLIKSRISTTYNWKRLLVEVAGINLIASILGMLLYFFFPVHSSKLSGPPIDSIVKAPLMCFFFGCVLITIYEAWINFYDNHELKLSLKSLEKEQLGLKLNSLQQKLDPHFMFNSLNVLSELVHEDSEKADKFIHQFSKVYRNVLDLNNQSVVTLSRELECLESYLYLLKIRLGASLKIENTIDKQLYDLMIPPLSLQLLIENSIKHNAASSDVPLEIKLMSIGNSILVSNNKNLRLRSKGKGGIGLMKLTETYRLLSQEPPIIKEAENKFSVQLPLIEK